MAIGTPVERKIVALTTQLGTTTFSPTTTVTASTRAVLMLVSNANKTATAVSDSVGNTWTVHTTNSDGTRAHSYASCYPTTQITSSDTITITWSAATSSSVGIGLIQVSGLLVDTASVFDQTNSHGQSSGATATSNATSALAQAAELVLGQQFESGNTSVTAGSGFTLFTAFNPGFVYGEYQIVSATTGIAATFGTTGGLQQTSVATFKADAGPRTASDTAGGTDTATRALAVSRTASDTAGGTDAATRALAFARTCSDTAGGTDSATRALIAARTSSDTAGTADAATRALSLARTGTDTAGGTDSATRAPVVSRTASDTAGAMDAATRLEVSARTSSDTAGAADSASGRLVFARSSTDTAGGTDAASGSVVSGGQSRTAIDIAGATDSAVRILSIARISSDTAGGTDSATRLGTAQTIRWRVRPHTKGRTLSFEPLAATSTEYVGVIVSADDFQGGTINPTGDTVQMAFIDSTVDTDPLSDDWKTASWVTDSTKNPPVYRALCLVGPSPGVIQLTAGSKYAVFVKVVDNPELPVKRVSGTLSIT